MFSIRLAAVLLLFSALAGCGGGGGGGGSSGAGSDGLSVSTSALTFTMPSGGPAPSSQDVAVTVTNSSATQVGAAYGPGHTPAPWLNIAVSGTAPNYTFRFSANPAGVPAGTHTARVSIGMARADGSIIAYRDVSVALNVAAELTLSQTALTAVYLFGSTNSWTTPVEVSGNGEIAWTASAVANPSWLTLSAVNGTTPARVNVGLNSAGLAPGTYTASVAFTGGGSTRTLDVTVVLQDPSLVLSRTELTFNGINGAEIPDQGVSIHMSNSAPIGWTFSSSAPWLVAKGRSSRALPGAASFGVNPAIGPLASGVHTATITFSCGYGGRTFTNELPVTLNLTPATLSVNTPAIVLGGAEGGDTTSVPVQLSLNTGTKAYPWSVSGVATGAQLAPLSGSVSSTPVTVTTRPLTTAIGNTYSATATFAATVNGDTVTRQVPMTVRIKPYRLFVHDTGVALTSSPTLAKLTQSIAVRDNRGTPIAWTATSDQAWLTVTNGSGTTPASFQLTANPDSLPMEAITYANVTVSSTDARVANTEIVRVGLYRTAASPASQVEVTMIGTEKRTGIVADPVRPYAYITHGTSTVDVYDIYSGALLHTIDAGSGSDLRSLAIDDEGGRLYAADHGLPGIRVFDIDAATPTLAATWTDARWSNCTTCAGTFNYADLDYTRVNGRGVLVGGGSQIIDATDGALLIHDGGSYFVRSLAASVSGDGSKLFTASLDTSGHSVGRRTLDFDELNDVVRLGDALVESKYSSSRGVSTDYDGRFVYRACWYSSQQIERYDGATLATLSAIDSGGNGGAILGPDGLVYCARYYRESPESWPDVWAVNPTTGAVVASHEYNVDAEVGERQFTISGDGLRVLTRSQELSSPSSSTFTSTTISP